MCDLRRGETLGVAVDVWALGVSLYKLLFLRDLFGTPGEERLGILNFDPSRKLRAQVLPPTPPEAAAREEALLDLLRACLTPSAARRPSVQALLQRLRTARIDAPLPLPDGTRASSLERSAASHTAGMLTISELRATGLFPKSATAAGVKAYVLLACGGQRRVTPVAPRGHAAHWSLALAVPTHALQTIELTIWAAHTRTTHDFLGGLTLSLHALIGDPTVATRIGPQGRPLQKRTHKSRVAGEISMVICWEPFAAQVAPPPPAAASLQATAPQVAAAPSANPPCPPLVSDAVAAHTNAGSFWSAGFANDFPDFNPLPPPPPVAAAAQAPVPPTHAAIANGSAAAAGSFWASDATAAHTFGSLGGCGASTAPAPPSDAFDAFNAAPPPLVFTSSATEFESVATVAAPWEMAGADGATNALADPGSFWATFDASPALPAAGAAPQAPQAPQGLAVPRAALADGVAMIEFGSTGHARPPTTGAWSDLSMFDGGAGGFAPPATAASDRGSGA